ncbi:hypothetical protein AB0I60_34725 [Actinosynnema sp. NPDC050436]
MRELCGTTFLSLADGDQAGLRVGGPADTDPSLLADELRTLGTATE